MNEQNTENQDLNTEVDVDALLDKPLDGVPSGSDEVKSDDTESQDVSNETKGEEETEEFTESQEESVEEKTKPKKVSGFKRRLDRERQARIAAEERARELEQQLQPKQQKQDRGTGEPVPDSYENGINDIQYIKDMSRWEGKQGFLEAKKADQTKAEKEKYVNDIKKADKNFQESRYDAMDKYADWDEVVNSRAVNLNDAVTYSVKNSPYAGDIEYTILKNPKLIARLESATPVEGIKIIGQLETKFSNPDKPSAGKSKFTKPFKSVNSGKSDHKPSMEQALKNQADFNELYPFESLNNW